VFGGRDNKSCCLWYSIGLGVRGKWVSVFDILWILLGIVFRGVRGGGVWPQVSIVGVCGGGWGGVRVAWRV